MITNPWEIEDIIILIMIFLPLNYLSPIIRTTKLTLRIASTDNFWINKFTIEGLSICRPQYTWYSWIREYRLTLQVYSLLDRLLDGLSIMIYGTDRIYYFHHIAPDQYQGNIFIYREGHLSSTETLSYDLASVKKLLLDKISSRAPINIGHVGDLPYYSFIAKI